MRAQQITLTEHSSDVVHFNSDPAGIILTACDMARVGVRSWPIAAAVRVAHVDIQKLERDEWNKSEKFTPCRIVNMKPTDIIRSNDLNDTFNGLSDLLSTSSWVDSVVIGLGSRPVRLDTLLFETPVSVVEKKNAAALKVRAIFRCTVSKPFKDKFVLIWI